MEANKRRMRVWAAPSGVDPEDLKEWYESLNFGGSEDGNDKPFDPSRFSSEVDGVLEMYRELSRQGRSDSERIRELEEGKPQRVLGETISEEQGLGDDPHGNVELGSEGPESRVEST